MDLRDATLMLLTESQAHPDLHARVQAAYDEMTRGRRCLIRS